mmetsp:Transcript_38083/g.79812  ORF Transcript_38083/g.79812 Transcript_38083/m.79812 type:complete len:261 (+) Transcript_38083:734-1516(+)
MRPAANGGRGPLPKAGGGGRIAQHQRQDHESTHLRRDHGLHHRGRQGAGGPAVSQAGQGQAQGGERGRQPLRFVPLGCPVVSRGAGRTRVQFQLGQVDRREERYGGEADGGHEGAGTAGRSARGKERQGERREGPAAGRSLRRRYLQRRVHRGEPESVHHGDVGGGSTPREGRRGGGQQVQRGREPRQGPSESTGRRQERPTRQAKTVRSGGVERVPGPVDRHAVHVRDGEGREGHVRRSERQHGRRGQGPSRLEEQGVR